VTWAGTLRHASPNEKTITLRSTPAPRPANMTRKRHARRAVFLCPAVCRVAGHRDINTTMSYKAVYPEEVISGHRAFIARRRALRPSAEYRTPTDDEWDEFLGHFAASSPSATADGHTAPAASTSTAA
jgi:hypothetical protein